MIVFDFISEKPLATYDDYKKTPEGGKYQLIGGEIIEMTAPTLYHQEILQNLNYYLSVFIRQNKLGKVYIAPTDVYFSKTETYQPDILILLTESLHKMQESKIDGAPDLVVEILSPSTGYYDVKYKKSVYEKFGVKEYWIVDPKDKTVEIYENSRGKFILVSELSKTDTAKSILLSGFEIELEKIF
ncbi:MAG: Uma2 family endonuclease [Leptospiraceae bacterium]|nr:Uma2 family endonuclease [Leptospiraceae bacterium]